MIVIEVRFLAGRFHATPWGRNVNEGAAEWPLSPFRLARCLIDIWKRKFPELTSNRIERIITALCEPPYFHLPSATTAHTRSFLSSNKENSMDKQKIFDSFVVVSPQDPLYIRFDSQLSTEDANILDTLLRHINYLGRSESWIDACMAQEMPDVIWNCKPVWTNKTHIGPTETVAVACIQSPAKYASLSIRPERKSWQVQESGKGECTLFEAVTLSTADIKNEGWSDHPGLAWVEYDRPAEVSTTPSVRSNYKQRELHYIKYAVNSNVLPTIEQTVSVAERVRMLIMGINRRINGGKAELVSQIFSGKDTNGNPLTGHEHAFYFPLDEDRDGRIDHIVVQAKHAFKADEIQSLDALRSIWQPDGREDLRLVLTASRSECRPLVSRVWISATPFVTGRHYRKGRGELHEWLRQEIERECDYHGLPHPKKIGYINSTQHTMQPRNWLGFLRSRKGDNPLQGYGFVLEFEEPVSGYFALGALSHYGLGLFMPWKN